MYSRKRSLTLAATILSLANLADFFGTFGFIWTILKVQLHFGNYFADATAFLSFHSWTQFLRNEGVLALTGLAIFISFLLGKREGKRLFVLAPSLFTSAKIPKTWSGTKMASAVVTVVVGYLVNLFLMGYYIDKILVLSGLLCFVFVVSIGSNELLRHNFERYLNDSRYAPATWSKEFQYIMTNRDIVLQFLFTNRHQTREIIALTLCAAIGVLNWTVQQTPLWAGYILIVIVVLSNEFVLYQWRYRRDLSLMVCGMRHLHYARRNQQLISEIKLLVWGRISDVLFSKSR